MSTNIIGDEWAKKNAGIFSGEEGRSSSAFSHSSLVFGAVTVIGAVGLVVTVRDLHGVVRGKDERAARGFEHRWPIPEKGWLMDIPVQ